MAGNALGGPALGGGLAAGTMALGAGGRALATRQTEQAAAMADLIARNGGRIDPSALNLSNMDDVLRRFPIGLGAQTYPTYANDAFWFQRAFGASPASAAAAEQEQNVR